jgi:hypothetical protein
MHTDTSPSPPQEERDGESECVRVPSSPFFPSGRHPHASKSLLRLKTPRAPARTALWFFTWCGQRGEEEMRRRKKKKSSESPPIPRGHRNRHWPGVWHFLFLFLGLMPGGGVGGSGSARAHGGFRLGSVELRSTECNYCTCLPVSRMSVPPYLLLRVSLFTLERESCTGSVSQISCLSFLRSAWYSVGCCIRATYNIHREEGAPHVQMICVGFPQSRCRFPAPLVCEVRSASPSSCSRTPTC